jgi:hypothetical protein
MKREEPYLASRSQQFGAGFLSISLRAYLGDHDGRCNLVSGALLAVSLLGA